MYPAELQHREKTQRAMCVLLQEKFLVPRGKRDWQEAMHLGPHA